MIRLFAALPVPAEIGQTLGVIQSGVPGARWRSPEVLHITLRFFSEVAETTAADLDEALAGLNAEAFEVGLVGAGVFGSGEQMRAVWAGVEAGAPLARLGARCETAARRCGLKPESRTFRPHVTLAYLKHSPSARVAAWVQANSLLRTPSWRAEALHLYSSWRSTEGSRYEIERTYPLL